MRCIYVRHGITQFSIDNKFAGRLDIPIVDIDTSNLLKNAFTLVEKYKPTILIHSPLIRTFQTAQYFIELFDFENIIIEPLLIERDFGEFEGKIKSIENRANLSFGANVEHLNTFDKRISDFLSKYKNTSTNILIVGHSAFYRQLSLKLNIQNKTELNCCEAHYFEIKN